MSYVYVSLSAQKKYSEQSKHTVAHLNLQTDFSTFAKFDEIGDFDEVARQ